MIPCLVIQVFAYRSFCVRLLEGAEVVIAHATNYTFLKVFDSFAKAGVKTNTPARTVPLGR